MPYAVTTREELNERQRANYAANRERRAARARTYRALNRDRINAQARANYAANRDRKRELAAAWRAANPDKVRAQQRRSSQHRDRGKDRVGGLRRRHGMSAEEWDALWEAQRGRCYLCGAGLVAENRGTHVDHDHRCCPPHKSCALCRRGLSCGACNLIVGKADDDPGRLRLVADRLEQATAEVTRRLERKPALF